MTTDMDFIQAMSDALGETWNQEFPLLNDGGTGFPPITIARTLAFFIYRIIPLDIPENSAVMLALIVESFAESATLNTEEEDE